MRAIEKLRTEVETTLGRSHGYDRSLLEADRLMREGEQARAADLYVNIVQARFGAWSYQARRAHELAAAVKGEST